MEELTKTKKFVEKQSVREDYFQNNHSQNQSDNGDEIMKKAMSSFIEKVETNKEIKISIIELRNRFEGVGSLKSCEIPGVPLTFENFNLLKLKGLKSAMFSQRMILINSRILNPSSVLRNLRESLHDRKELENQGIIPPIFLEILTSHHKDYRTYRRLSLSHIALPVSKLKSIYSKEFIQQILEKCKRLFQFFSSHPNPFFKNFINKEIIKFLCLRDFSGISSDSKQNKNNISPESLELDWKYFFELENITPVSSVPLMGSALASIEEFLMQMKRSIESEKEINSKLNQPNNQILYHKILSTSLSTKYNFTLQSISQFINTNSTAASINDVSNRSTQIRVFDEICHIAKCIFYETVQTKSIRLYQESPFYKKFFPKIQSDLVQHWQYEQNIRELSDKRTATHLIRQACLSLKDPLSAEIIAKPIRFWECESAHLDCIDESTLETLSIQSPRQCPHCRNRKISSFYADKYLAFVLKVCEADSSYDSPVESVQIDVKTGIFCVVEESAIDSEYFLQIIIHNTSSNKMVALMKESLDIFNSDPVQQKVTLSSFEADYSTAIDISLRKQYNSKEWIKYPLRSIEGCTHPECFDISDLFAYNSTRNSNLLLSEVLCPICNKSITFSNIIIDSEYKNIINVCKGIFQKSNLASIYNTQVILDPQQSCYAQVDFQEKSFRYCDITFPFQNQTIVSHETASNILSTLIRS